METFKYTIALIVFLSASAEACMSSKSVIRRPIGFTGDGTVVMVSGTFETAPDGRVLKSELWLEDPEEKERIDLLTPLKAHVKKLNQQKRNNGKLVRMTVSKMVHGNRNEFEAWALKIAGRIPSKAKKVDCKFTETYKPLYKRYYSTHRKEYVEISDMHVHPMVWLVQATCRRGHKSPIKLQFSKVLSRNEQATFPTGQLKVYANPVSNAIFLTRSFNHSESFHFNQREYTLGEYHLGDLSASLRFWIHLVDHVEKYQYLFA